MPNASEDTLAQAAAERLGDQLLGTCQDPHGSEEWEQYKNDPEFCARLDSKVMRCDSCGWWAESHEIDDNGNCKGCSEQDEDEER